MKIILTNDDGRDAPGIQALLQAVEGKTIMVAPQGQLSGCGHQVTTHSPIHVDRRSSFEYAVGEHRLIACASLFITFVRSRIWCFRVLTRVAIWGLTCIFRVRWRLCRKQPCTVFRASQFPTGLKGRSK